MRNAAKRSSDARVVTCPGRAPGQVELSQMIEALMDSMPWVRDKLAASRSILVKPNLGGGDAPSMTSKEVMVAFCRYLRENYDATLTLGDSSVIGSTSERSIEALGLRGALEPLGVRVVDLASFPVRRVEIPSGRVLKVVSIYEPTLDTDCLVSLAKLKTNYATRTSLTIKNLKGILSGPDKIRFHRLGVADCLADLLTVVAPGLGVIDGIQGWDIDRSVDVGALVGGTDLVAVDYLGAMLSQTDPAMVTYLTLALERGLGGMPGEAEQAAARAASRPFAGPLDNAAAMVLPEGIRVVAGEACSGCISILQRAFRRMESEGVLRGLPPLTVAIGPGARPSREPGRLIVAMGNCCGARDEADRVMVGCPPQSRYEVQRVFEELRDDKDQV